MHFIQKVGFAGPEVVCAVSQGGSAASQVVNKGYQVGSTGSQVAMNTSQCG